MHNNTKNNKPSHTLGVWILSFVITLLSACAGILSTSFMNEKTQKIVGFSCFCSILLFLLLAVLSALGAKLYVRKMNQRKVAEVKDYVLSRKESAEADPISVMKKIDRLKWMLWGVYLICALFLIVFPYGCGIIRIVSGKSYDLGGLLFSCYMTNAILNRLFSLKTKPDFSEYTDKDTIPQLYVIAASAAEAVGVEIKGQIRIILLPDCNAGICRMGKDVSLQLGTQLISVLRPNELYQVLLHEFAHLQNETKVYKFGTSTAYRFLIAENDSLSDNLIDWILRFPGIVASVEFEICRMVLSEHSERIADGVSREVGEPALGAAALCKIAMSELFDQHMDDYIDDHFYAPEDVRTDVNQVVCHAFARAIETNGAFWRSLMDRELVRPLGSHPIFRQRWEALGAPAFEIILPDKDTPYYADCIKAQEIVSRRVVENLQEDYPSLRKENYLDPLQQVKEYEASEKKLTAPEIPPLLQAYGALGRYKEQEALCDCILADESFSEYETVSALYVKGLLLLNRYDEAGVDLIYRAMEMNSNYVDDGLERVGQFLHWMGLEDRMEVHREKAVELAQKNQDEIQHTGILNPSDELTEEDFDGDGRLPEMLDYMVKAGEGKLSEIYLVRKIITPTFFTSAFVLRYVDGLSAEEQDEIHEKVFYYLDNSPHDWQYSLFDYDQQTAKAVKKVSTSCVYRKG